MPISPETPNQKGLPARNRSFCRDPPVSTGPHPHQASQAGGPHVATSAPALGSSAQLPVPFGDPLLAPKPPVTPQARLPSLPDGALSHSDRPLPSLISLPDHPQTGLLTLAGACPAVCDLWTVAPHVLRTAHPPWVTPCPSSRTRHRPGPFEKPSERPSGAGSLPPWP